MAYDKVVDSGVLDGKLTGIADAIRGKTGKTEEMTLDQMPREIEGIQTGIEPSGSINISTNGAYDVTEYAEAVVNVASSGGTSAIYSGSFTPAENLNIAEIEIGGVITHFLCYAIGSVTGNSLKATCMCTFDLTTPNLLGISTNNGGSALTTVITFSSLKLIDDGTAYQFPVNNSNVYYYLDDNRVKITSGSAGICFGAFIAGVTYLWYAW